MREKPYVYADKYVRPWGCRCDRPLPENEPGLGLQCIKCGHGIGWKRGEKC